MTTSQPATFALVPGAVAWARRDSPSASGLWWPVILYPTWATAAKESGLMDLRVTQQPGADKTKESVRLVGCKRPVSLTFLRENKVPRALVLRPRPAGAGPMARPGPQNRVVAHFLGLATAEHATDDSVAAWGAVDMASLRPYRQDCCDVLAACRGKVGRADWIDLLRGIDEASIVLEDWTVASKELLRNVPEAKQPVGSCKKSSVTKSALLGVETFEANDAGNVMDGGHNENNDNDDEEASLGQTPEFYDDWKGTESQSQRNTQFSQVFNFSQAQSYGEKEETVPATATEEKAKTTDEPSVEMIDEKKKDAPTGVDENADGEEASVATVKATNVSVSNEKSTEDSASKHSIGEEMSEEKEPVSVVAEKVDVDTSAPTASAMETEPSIGAGMEANKVAAPLDTLQEDNGEEQKEEQSKELKETVITEEERNDAAKVEAITVPTSTDDAAAAEFSDGEELSDYGPESQDISNMDTQPHSNLTDPACTISPQDGAPKNLKRRSLASILGRKSKESSTNTGATTTPFVSSKGSIKKVSPSPMADAAENATGSAAIGDDDLDEGLESKRLFEGNANLSEKRMIESAGCEDRDANAKKPRSEDAYFSAEEMDEDEGLNFFTQQG